MTNDADVIVIGAGVAGLAAALQLARGGKSVQVFEARDRAGGRVHTARDPQTGFAIELGAEFIHGRPPILWNLLQSAGAEIQEIGGTPWCSENGQLERCNFFSEVESLLAKMDDTGADRSFSDFLREHLADTSDETRRRALRYITGFHAANPDLISVHALVRGLRADEQIGGEQAFRAREGYSPLLLSFEDTLRGLSVPVQLGCVVQNLDWAQGRVRVHAARGKEGITLTAEKALITLPLGVLQAPPGSTGAIRFDPDLPQKRAAAAQLEMGSVIRVTLCLREPVWEKTQGRAGTGAEPLRNLGFLFSDDDLFPTWWTLAPDPSPVITGWAPAESARRLAGLPKDEVVTRAVESLARILHQPAKDLQNALVASYTHDWKQDEFARGAYSYVRVNGEAAKRQLAEAVQNTLFFAGEATDAQGRHGTVDGAIATGMRAAREILG